jgi:hypothetical protein
MLWKDYEEHVLKEFKAKYQNCEILYNQHLTGRYSRVPRQVDILVRAVVADVEVVGVFDCKHFNKNVNVKVIDSMIGFIDDVGARFGGVVTARAFSEGARNRAEAAKLDLRVIQFVSAAKVIDSFAPSMNFSDPRNSMYLAII